MHGIFVHGPNSRINSSEHLRNLASKCTRWNDEKNASVNRLREYSIGIRVKVMKPSYEVNDAKIIVEGFVKLIVKRRFVIRKSFNFQIHVSQLFPVIYFDIVFLYFNLTKIVSLTNRKIVTILLPFKLQTLS